MKPLRLLEHSLTLLVLAIALPVVAARGAFTFGSVTFDLMRDTRAMVEGGGFAALSPLEPPGYSLLLAPFLVAGVDPMVAGAALSLLASIVSVFLARAILRQELTDRWAVVVGIGVFLVQEKLVTYGIQAWVEGVYIAATLGAFSVFGRLVQNRYRATHPAHVLLFALIIAAPFYLRYIGILVSVSVCLALLLGASRKRSETGARDGRALRDCLAVCGVVGALALLLLARNYYMTGTVTGDPVGLSPAYTFVVALRETVRQTGLDSMGIPYRAAEELSRLAPGAFLAFSTVALVALLLSTARRPLPLLIAFNVGAYIILFAYQESSMRMDLVSARFVYPLVPLIALLLIMLAARVSVRSWRLPALAAIALLTISTAGGAFKIVRGWRGEHQERIFGYSPATTRATLMLAREQPGTGIAANRFGAQLQAYSSRLNFTLIPYTDHLNGAIQEAYGIHPWSEEQARAHFRGQRIEWLIFFEGPNRADPYMTAGSYGPFVGKIYRGEVPAERRRIETPDGLLVQMDPSKW